MKVLEYLATLYIDFSDAQGQLVRGRIWLNLIVTRTLMIVLIFCKNEEDQIKNEGARVFTISLYYKSMGLFPDTRGQFTPQSMV